MPNWKKVIVSGSDASLNSLYVTNAVTASVFSGSFTGSLFGTSSYAISASQAITSSYAISSSYATSASQAITSSFVTGSDVFGPYGSNSVISSSYAISASYGATSSYASEFNVVTALTASGLRYPTTDGTVEQFLNTDGAGNLSFANVRTLYQNIRNKETSSIVKGTPLFVSGSTGDNADVFRADAGNPARMPATLIAGDNTLAPNAVGRGIILGHIEGVDTTGYAAGTLVYVGVGGGWTATSPTGSAIVQPLGVVTREGNNGMGIVLTVPPNSLPNIQQGYVWIGDANGVPQAVATSSIQNVISSSYAGFAQTIASGLDITASNLLVNNTITASFISATSASFGYVTTITGSAVIIGQEYIVLNTQSPAARYAGLQIYDSGSTATASIVWDSQTNHFVYENVSGSSYSGGGFLAGPKNTGSLADITYPTLNRVLRSQGDDHVYDSNIFDDDTTIRLEINTEVTGTLKVTNGITGSLFGTASYAADSNLLDGYDSAAFLLTSSYNNFTASYYLDSASFDTRILNVSSSVGILSSSFLAASASFDTRILNNSSSIGILSSSFLNASASFDTRILNNSSSIGILSSSFLNASASFDTRILNNSSSIGLLSSSFLAFSSSYNTGSFTGSFIGVFTGSLQGTASFAVTSSFVTGSDVYGPFGSNSILSASFAVSASHAPNALTASYAISASQAISSSYAVTSSYATFALSASNAPGFTTNFSQSVAATTWSFSHNLNTRNPLVQVYSPTFAQLVPNEIVGIDAFTVEIRFDYAQAGYAVASNGGGLYVTGSTPRLVQTVAAVTWSFQHNLGTKYPGYEVYDSNDNVIVPAGIRSVDINNAEIYFAFPTTGVAIANFSGISGSLDNAISSSYAATASYSDAFYIDQTLTDYATVASSINGSNTVFTQATGSYTSAFFKYTVASASNARSGEVMCVWNGASAQFTDTSTVDIGVTSAVTSSVVISGANVLFNVQTNTAGWRIKSMGTFI